MAQRGKSNELARVLIENGCDLEQLNKSNRSALHRHLNSVTKYIVTTFGHGTHLYDQDHDGIAIIHYLCWSKTIQTKDVHRLLSSTDNSVLALRDSQGRLPLHFALTRGNTELVRYLLERNTHPNTALADSDGATLLHYAVQSKRVNEVFDLVAPYCQNIFQRDNLGRSLLHHAVFENNVAGVRKIIEMGGQELLHVECAQGKTPLQLAVEIDATQVIEYLRTLLGEEALRDLSVHQKVEPGVRPSTHSSSESVSTWNIDQGFWVVLIIVAVWLLPSPYSF